MSNRAILKLAMLVGVVVAGWVLLTIEPAESTSRRSRWSPQEALVEATAALTLDNGRDGQWRMLGSALASHAAPFDATRSWISEHGSIAPWAEAYAWYWTAWGLWHLSSRDMAMTSFETAAPAFESLCASGSARPVDLYRRARTLHELGRTDAAAAALEELVSVLRAEAPSPGADFTRVSGMAVSLWVSMDEPVRAAETIGALASGLTTAPADRRGQSVGELLQQLVRSARNPNVRDAAFDAIEAFDAAARTSSDHARVGHAWHDLSMSDRATASWRAAFEAHIRAGDLSAELRSNPTWLYNLACYAALCGERDAALDAWEDAVAAGWKDWRHASLDEDLDSVRGLERFAAQYPAEQRALYLEKDADAGGSSE